MAASSKLARVEAKLFVRDPIALFFGLVFPGLLLLLLGLVYPGFDEPSADLGGDRFIDIYAPVTLGLGLATVGLVVLPPILGTYRQLGILRRFRTTPVSPARLLGAQLTVHTSVAIAAAAIAVTVAVVAFDLPFPESPVWFLIAFVLAVASIFAIGLLVGALVRSSTSGAAAGMGVYFPMLFFAGVWVPRTIMPDGLRTVSDLTAVGAAVQALEDSWFGITPSFTHILVMVAWTVVVGFLAVRLFRWE